jgi:type VI secretion system protein ImpK
VRAVGKGDADPIASNATADGRQQNRRTEVVLLKTTNLP